MKRRLCRCGIAKEQCVLPAQTFVIEGEDFDFDGRQHLPVVDIMPYYGGAYDGYSAVADIDYHLDDLVLRFDFYRSDEEPSVPMLDVSGDAETLSRGSWDVAFTDLGSDGERLVWTLEQRSPFFMQLFSEPLDGTGPGSLSLNRGTYRLHVTAPTEDPTISGKYRFRVDLN